MCVCTLCWYNIIIMSPNCNVHADTGCIVQTIYFTTTLSCASRRPYHRVLFLTQPRTRPTKLKAGVRTRRERETGVGVRWMLRGQSQSHLGGVLPAPLIQYHLDGQRYVYHHTCRHKFVVCVWEGGGRGYYLGSNEILSWEHTPNTALMWGTGWNGNLWCGFKFHSDRTPIHPSYLQILITGSTIHRQCMQSSTCTYN